MSLPSEGTRSYRPLGLALLGLLLIQQAGALRWPWLGQLQADDVYKQLSGFTLLAFTAQQWRLSLLRARGKAQQATRMLGRHKLVGVAAPVLFYFHSEQLGYAYQAALSLAFLAIFATGLCNLEAFRAPWPWFRTAWITTHVGLATLLPFLLGYHIFVTYSYE